MYAVNPGGNPSVDPLDKSFNTLVVRPNPHRNKDLGVVQRLHLGGEVVGVR